MRIPRFLRFEKYEVIDMKEFISDGRIDIYLKRNRHEAKCSRCRSNLGAQRGHYAVKIEAMSIMGLRTYIHFQRYKGHCDICKKARTEYLPWVSELTRIIQLSLLGGLDASARSLQSAEWPSL